MGRLGEALWPERNERKKTGKHDGCPVWHEQAGLENEKR